MCFYEKVQNIYFRLFIHQNQYLEDNVYAQYVFFMLIQNAYVNDHKTFQQHTVPIFYDIKDALGAFYFSCQVLSYFPTLPSKCSRSSFT